MGILIGSPIVSTIGLPMSGHLFVWSSSRVDNLTTLVGCSILIT
nr:MAG TPA: hypothetical protein [Caudoviricetes sp.]